MNIKEIAFDLETIRDPRATPFIPEKGPRDRADPSEKVAFDPNYIMPCVAGFYDGDNAWSIGLNEFSASMCMPGETIEAAFLRQIWHDLENVETIVTFNGHSFDLPLLLRRSWYHNVKPSRFIDLRKYQSSTNHIDVRMVLSNWDSHAKGGLDLYCQLKLGCGKPDGIDGSKVQELWDKGQHEAIHAYCRQDVKLTWDLYQSLKGFYL